ncbi:MAG: hypothetical protein H6674_10805 [Dehalococcoidia bacterium]|nr:hypothetical protein [Dehalococcoidia bacterium]MCB9597274.1 hypothetical protein [Sandaracinaceae bacterium]
MTLVEIESREAAIALAKAIGALARYARDGVGLPRCEHPRWRLTGGTLERHLRRVTRSRGVVPRCLCASQTEPSARCPHVTWQAASVLELADGTLLVEAEDAALAELPGPRPTTRELTEDEREAAEQTWTLRAERRAQQDDEG